MLLIAAALSEPDEFGGSIVFAIGLLFVGLRLVAKGWLARSQQQNKETIGKK